MYEDDSSAYISAKTEEEAIELCKKLNKNINKKLIRKKLSVTVKEIYTTTGMMVWKLN